MNLPDRSLHAGRRLDLGAVIVLILAAGCSDDRDPVDPAGELRALFPDQAMQVLAGARGFTAASKGFVVGEEEPSAMPGALGVHLPRRGEDEIRLVLPSGRAVQVREAGAWGEGAARGQAVAYRREGGASFWRWTAAGFEEWLHVAACPPSGEVGTWEVEGLVPRQHGPAVDLLDEGGVARITVSAPVAYGRDGSTVPVRLLARGSAIVAQVEAAAGEAVLVDPVWVPTGSMADARRWHKAVLLQDGRVLVTGGEQDPNGDVILQTAELYDPATHTWMPAAPMAFKRESHTATVLKDGHVLVTGGRKTGDTAELYDPTMDKWQTITTMIAPRADHTATLLLDGRVLIAGGNDGIASAEVYDPTNNTWTATPPVYSPPLSAWSIFDHTSTLLLTGEALVAGGSGETNEAARYDPMSNTWTKAASMHDPRSEHTATLLFDGKVLIAGGHTFGTSLIATEIYDPATDTWVQSAPMSTARSSHAATTLIDGTVLITGGSDDNDDDLDTTEIYEPLATTWTPALLMVVRRSIHTAVRLQAGDVLLAGGYNGDYLASAERYGELGKLGTRCGVDGECVTGHCAGGVCCDTYCWDVCNACSMKAGADKDGTCKPIDEGLACKNGIQDGICTSGDCVYDAGSSSTGSTSTGTGGATGDGGGMSDGGVGGWGVNGDVQHIYVGGCGCEVIGTAHDGCFESILIDLMLTTAMTLRRRRYTSNIGRKEI